MTRIVQLTESRRGGFRRATGIREQADASGQLHLFSAATVHRLDAGLSPFEEAVLLDRRGRAGAEDAYRRAVASGDRAADAWCNLGTIAADAGRHDDALEAFGQALAAESGHPEAHYNLGCLYLDMGLYAPARVHLGIAAAGEPDVPDLQFNLAIAFAGIGRLTDAAACLRNYRVHTQVRDAGADRLLEELERVLLERA